MFFLLSVALESSISAVCLIGAEWARDMVIYHYDPILWII
jgi:hypothetical protein